MKLKELLLILPETLDISVQHDSCRTGSLVRGLLQFDSLADREVISAEPNYIKSIGIQSFNVTVE